MKPVAIYQDYVHNHAGLLMAMQDLRVPFMLIDAPAILGGGLDIESYSALIVPGGADLFYCEKLNGAGNDAIRAFVEQGGGYLGLCAGAYYGTRAIDWDNGAIAGDRELNFIDTLAAGPIFDFIQAGDIKQSWYSAPEIKTDAGTFLTLYGAGPLFTNIKGNVDVYARYTTQGDVPAVIGTRVGHGYVVLSSPHIEVLGERFAQGRYAHRNAFEAYERTVGAKLAPHLAAQKKFLTMILEKIGAL